MCVWEKLTHCARQVEYRVDIWDGNRWWSVCPLHRRLQVRADAHGHLVGAPTRCPWDATVSWSDSAAGNSAQVSQVFSKSCVCTVQKKAAPGVWSRARVTRRGLGRSFWAFIPAAFARRCWFNSASRPILPASLSRWCWRWSNARIDG